MTDTPDVFEGWAIVELFGHRKLAGYCKQQDMFGGSFLRLDVPAAEGAGFGPNNMAATQFYGASAIYCITPTTEAIARNVAPGRQPAPVTPWELPALPACSDAQDADYAGD
ncbi:MAG: acetyltransferase [Phycisphaerales bacterium]